MSAFDSSTTTATSLPSWYTTAQQNLGTAAANAGTNSINPQSTVAQGLVESLGSNTNPFTQGTAQLSNIASGIANPWLPNGQPNTNTTLGGLFASQNAQLNQMLPTIASTQGAAGIGSGQSGSLRDQTAIDAAKAGALTTLAANQNTTAENALTQAIQAEAAAGNLGAQYGATALNTANFQELGALPAINAAATDLSNLGATVPKTTAVTTNQGLTANVAQAANLLNQGGALGTGVLNALSGSGSTSALPTWLTNLLTPSSTPTYTGTYSPLDTSSYGGTGNYNGYTTGSDTNITSLPTDTTSTGG